MKKMPEPMAQMVAYDFGGHYFVGFQIPKTAKGWKSLMDSVGKLKSKGQALKRIVTFLLLTYDKHATPEGMPVSGKLLRKSKSRSSQSRSRVRTVRKPVPAKVRH